MEGESPKRSISAKSAFEVDERSKREESTFTLQSAESMLAATSSCLLVKQDYDPRVGRSTSLRGGFQIPRHNISVDLQEQDGADLYAVNSEILCTELRDLALAVVKALLLRARVRPPLALREVLTSREQFRLCAKPRANKCTV